MSRLQFTTGAGHRRGRARQARPMRSRRPPCRRQQRSRRASLLSVIFPTQAPCTPALAHTSSLNTDLTRTHAHPTSPRSSDFCAIWGCISSSSSSWHQRGGNQGQHPRFKGIRQFSTTAHASVCSLALSTNRLTLLELGGSPRGTRPHHDLALNVASLHVASTFLLVLGLRLPVAWSWRPHSRRRRRRCHRGLRCVLRAHVALFPFVKYFRCWPMRDR